MTKRATPEELAQEAAECAKEAETIGTTSISIRLPDDLLLIIREFAQRQTIGYQILIKKWLNDRAREEAMKFLVKRFKDEPRS